MGQRIKTIAWRLTVLLLSVLVLLQTGKSPRAAASEKLYRVGVDHSPPFYAFRPDGSVTGLGVDVLNEAARRRNIRLQWIPLTNMPLDDALEKRTVDLWPLVGSTKSRREKLFLSKPWLESDYVLLSSASFPIRNPVDAAGRTVAHARLKLTAIIAQEYLSQSTLLVKQFREDAVHSFCVGEASAALVESRVLDAILLKRPKGCENLIFKISNLAGATSPLSIAAVPEAKEAAEGLRDGISLLAEDGTLSAMLDEWSPFSAQGMRSIWAREIAETRSAIYRASFRLALVFAVILGFAARRAYLLKLSAQASELRFRQLAQQQQQTLAELLASEQRWQLALNGAGDGLWDWDVASGTVYRSPGWKAMLGYPENEIGNSAEDWRRLVHPEDLERAQQALDSHLRSETACFSCDYRLRAKDGRWRWVSDRGQAVWDATGAPIRVAGAQTDITARMMEQEALSLEARTDGLTGLWNRREFDRVLAAETKAARNSGKPLALCTFDLDHFKLVNDRFGHAAGDQVLSRFGALLKESLRKRDTCCRLGGDEFVAILPETSAEDAWRLAEGVGSELRAIRFCSASGAEFRVKCSFGVGESGEGDSPEKVALETADGQLYKAKQRTGVIVFPTPRGFSGPQPPPQRQAI